MSEKIKQEGQGESRRERFSLGDCRYTHQYLSDLENNGVVLPDGQNAETLRKTTANELFDYAEKVVSDENFWSTVPKELPDRYGWEDDVLKVGDVKKGKISKEMLRQKLTEMLRDR